MLFNGTLLFKDAGEVFMTPGCQSYPNFDSGTGTGSDKPDEDGKYRYSKRTRAGHEACPLLEFTTSIKQTDDRLSITLEATADADVDLVWAGFDISLPVDCFKGGKYVVDDLAGEFPQEAAMKILKNGTARRIDFYDDVGVLRLGLRFSSPTAIRLQDGRRWGGKEYKLRILFKEDRRYVRGEHCSLSFDVCSSGGMAFREGGEHVRIAAGDEWIEVAPMPEIRPGSALDFSSWKHSGRAGRHGHVVSRNGHFEFALLPGVPQRFWGVNVNDTGCLMDADESQKFAAYLSRIGYNAVRIHHHDFRISREGSPDLDEGNMRKLDAFAAACIDNGIYLTTDLFVSRVHDGRLPYRSLGLDRDGTIRAEEYKDLIPFHRGVKDDYLAFARNFLCHVNPYTGRQWGREPALAFLSLVNEGTLGNFGMTNFKRFSDVVLPRWRRWLKSKQASAPDAYRDIPDTLPDGNLESACYGNLHAAAFNLFLADVEGEFVSDVRKLLGECGCKALVTDINAWYNPVTAQRIRSDMLDYVDEHVYFDHPQKVPGCLYPPPSYCPNANPVESDDCGGYPLFTHRILGKPYTISEWNYCAPGKCRSAGPLLISAYAALQEYSAAWRFTWSHGFKRNDERSRLGYFDVSTDPIQLASERIAFALFLRGDLAPLANTLVLQIPRKFVDFPERSLPLPRISGGAWLGWHYKIGTIVADGFGNGNGMVAEYPCWATRPVYGTVAKILSSYGLGRMPSAGDGAVKADSAKGVFAVATPSSEAIFGRPGRHEADRLQVDIGDVDATISVVALDGLSFDKTRRMLFTHLTDVQNTDTEFADSGFRYQLSYGKLPHLMRVAEARISMRLPKRMWSVCALEQDGQVRGTVESVYANGRLDFLADIARDKKHGAVFLYEVYDSSDSALGVKR